MSYAAPVLVITLVTAAAIKVMQRPAKFVMTPQRRIVFDTAMRELHNSDALREIAASFINEGGADPWGNLLLKRATLQDRPKEVKLAHREVFRKALICKNPDDVEMMAKSFEEMGATGCAAQLFEVAKGLRGATLVQGEYGFTSGAKKRRNRLARAEIAEKKENSSAVITEAEQREVQHNT